MLDWLIIGGGIHGTYLSHVLTAQGGVSRDRLRVLDPHVKPLARWDACTDNVGMAYLRSSFVHHLGIEPYALRAFAKERQLRDKKAFLGRYLRPSLRIFANIRSRVHPLEIFWGRGWLANESCDHKLAALQIALRHGVNDSKVLDKRYA